MTGLSALQQEPYRFDFYRALRLLECAFPDRPRLGSSNRPSLDPVRLGQQPTMAFPPGPLAAYEMPGGARKHGRLLVHVLGLLGPNGALPLHITEYVMERLRQHGDRTLAAFLDIFHHRLLSLFWRATANAQPTVELDRPAQDRFAFYLGCLTGFGTEALRGSSPEVDRVQRFWAGHHARQSHDAEGLQAMLAGFFDMPVQVEQFVGRWLPLPPDERGRIGRRGSLLGDTAFLGDQLWDCAQTIRIVCGPLDLPRYERLLPGGDGLRRMAEIVRSYLGDEIGWELRLVLHRDEVPPLRLAQGQRLGWTSWLGAEPPRRDPDDLLVQPDFEYHHQTGQTANQP